MERWQRIARRIRVPLGFLTAALYLFELIRNAPRPSAIAWSLVLVLPGLWLRGYSSGYVKKNRELTTTGPYAHTRNPLYLGSMLIAAGFAVIYIPVIASEERFLRAAFPQFDAYCRLVPRLVPRLTPARPLDQKTAAPDAIPDSSAPPQGCSLSLYLRHREYNAAIGAALIYLSLLFLRPAMAAFFDWVR